MAHAQMRWWVGLVDGAQHQRSDMFLGLLAFLSYPRQFVLSADHESQFVRFAGRRTSMLVIHAINTRRGSLMRDLQHLTFFPRQ